MKMNDMRCLFLAGMSDSTVTFLERLHNRTTKGIEEEIGKRVTFSKSIISQLIQFVDKRVTRGKDISKMLDELKNAKGIKTEEKGEGASSNGKTTVKEEEKTEDEKKEEAENQRKEADEGIIIVVVTENVGNTRFCLCNQ